jgi:SAM-dependent methyltransferase
MNTGYGTPEERYVDLHASYDELHPFDEQGEATVSFLDELVPHGKVLELAVGTGRIAIHLAARGRDVTGVDASPDMLDILKAKDPDGTVRTHLADMSNPGLTDQFDLIYLVANGLFELTTQDEQIACMTSAAELLSDGGRLVVEAALPNLLFADRRPLFVGPLDDLNTVTLQAMRYDDVNQIVQYRHVFISNDGIKVMPTTHRFVYLPELDLMAKQAGLRVASRHSDWSGGEFNPATGSHVSVYRKASSRTP